MRSLETMSTSSGDLGTNSPRDLNNLGSKRVAALAATLFARFLCRCEALKPQSSWSSSVLSSSTGKVAAARAPKALGASSTRWRYKFSNSEAFLSKGDANSRKTESLVMMAKAMDDVYSSLAIGKWFRIHVDNVSLHDPPKAVGKSMRNKLRNRSWSEKGYLIGRVPRVIGYYQTKTAKRDVEEMTGYCPQLVRYHIEVERVARRPRIQVPCERKKRGSLWVCPKTCFVQR